MLGYFQSLPITRCNKYSHICDLQVLAHVSAKFLEMELLVRRDHPFKFVVTAKGFSIEAGPIYTYRNNELKCSPAHTSPTQCQPSLKDECGKITSKTNTPHVPLGASISTMYNLKMCK